MGLLLPLDADDRFGCDYMLQAFPSLLPRLVPLALNTVFRPALSFKGSNRSRWSV